MTKRPNRRGAGALGLCLLALLAIPEEPAQADEPPAAVPDADVRARAKAYFQAGATLYGTGDYPGAHEQFKKAYELAPHPDLLFNLAKTAERTGHPDDAIGYLERYLSEKPTAPDRSQIESEIARLRQEAAKRAAEPQGAVPPPVVPPVKQPVPQKPMQWPPWPAVGLAGGGLVFLTIGIGLGIGALSASKQVAMGTSFDRSLDERGHALNGAAITFDVLGALALAGGVAWSGVWYFRDRKKQAALPLPTHGAFVFEP